MADSILKVHVHYCELHRIHKLSASDLQKYCNSHTQLSWTTFTDLVVTSRDSVSWSCFQFVSLCVGVSSWHNVLLVIPFASGTSNSILPGVFMACLYVDYNTSPNFSSALGWVDIDSVYFFRWTYSETAVCDFKRKTWCVICDVFLLPSFT